MSRSNLKFPRTNDFYSQIKPWLDVDESPMEFFQWQKKMTCAVPPNIEDFPQFLNALMHWWVQLQPSWREGEKLLQQRPESAEWGGLRIAGPCGLYSVVISLAWCIETCSALPVFASLIDDVIWTLTELVSDHDNDKSRRRSGRATTTMTTASGQTRGTKRAAGATQGSRKRSKK